MKMLDVIQALIFENLDRNEMMNYKFLNRSLLKSKLKYIQKADNIKPLFNKRQIIGSNSADIKCLVQVDYKTIATVSEDNKINLWDIYKCNLISTLIGHSRITSLLYFRRQLISSSSDSTMVVWDLLQNPENNYRVIRFNEGARLSRLRLINKNSFLRVSAQQILIFNYRFELINTLEVKTPIYVLPVNNYLIFQSYASNMEVLDLSNNLSPCRLTNTIQTACCPILLDGDTILLINSSYELILTEINNPQNQQIIKGKNYKYDHYKLLKLKYGRIAVFIGFTRLHIFKYEENLVTLVFDSDAYIFKHDIVSLLDDGRIIASAYRYDPKACLRVLGDLRIIDLNTFDNVCLQPSISSTSLILQLKDKSIISITDDKTIIKLF
jgi:WD40 repeat protein